MDHIIFSKEILIMNRMNNPLHLFGKDFIFARQTQRILSTDAILQATPLLQKTFVLPFCTLNKIECRTNSIARTSCRRIVSACSSTAATWKET